MVRPSDIVHGVSQTSVHGTTASLRPGVLRPAVVAASTVVPELPVDDMDAPTPQPRVFQGTSQAPSDILTQALSAPAHRFNVEFLLKRPDLLGLSAARLVQGLRALQRRYRPGDGSTDPVDWVAELLGCSRSMVRASPRLADALADAGEAELTACGVFALLADKVHALLPEKVLRDLHQVTQSGLGWKMVKHYPEQLGRGLGASADPKLNLTPTPMALQVLSDAEKTVSALSQSTLDPAGFQQVAVAVASSFERSVIRQLKDFAQTSPVAAYLEALPELIACGEAIFNRPEVRERLRTRLCQTGLQWSAPLLVRAPA